MPVCDREKTITCPYNPSHQITPARMQWHLIKCRKVHPQTENVICPYNASHHVPRLEEQFHVSNCQDRKIVEMSKYSRREERLNKPVHIPSVANKSYHVEEEEEEDWEKEATIKSSYNPTKKASEKNVLRKLEGATPSQRKEFRAQERVRLAELEAVESLKSRDRKVIVQHTSDPRPALPVGRGSVGTLLAAHIGRGGLNSVLPMKRPGGRGMTPHTSYINSTSRNTQLLNLGRGKPTVKKTASLHL